MPSAAKKITESADLPKTLRVHPDDLPDTYVMGCEGYCMSPELEDGDKLMFDKNAKVRPNDIVAIFLAPHFHWSSGHNVIVKRLILLARTGSNISLGGCGAGAMVECFNPPTVFNIPEHAILAMHKCMGRAPADLKTYLLPQSEIIAKAAASKAKAVRTVPLLKTKAS